MYLKYFSCKKGHFSSKVIETWGGLRIESLHSTSRFITLRRIIVECNIFKTVARTTINEDGTSTTTIPVSNATYFNKHKDAKSLFEAIEARFGGNEATKKTQKILLKKIQLTILGEIITPEDLNLKFLRSIPTKWGMHVVVWRNKSDMGSISFDDLYNNFKIVEPEVKRSVTSRSNSGSQNLAFVSGHSSTNDVNTANVHVSTGSTNNSTACPSDATRTGKKIIINGSDTAGYDKKKVECFNYHKLGYFARECRNPKSQENRSISQDNSRRTVNVEESSSKAMLAIDGTRFD
ncbi:ribonuclease H-like domain-containing protein [Tanacetum coccineum]|uniref:Ribonuclease H-like domain-containing protein n=1 Tax=Tanacetum coccineum TaxID=301880 RepID=A0ABQ5GCE0_9ASTR